MIRSRNPERDQQLVQNDRTKKPDGGHKTIGKGKREYMEISPEVISPLKKGRHAERDNGVLKDNRLIRN